MKLNLKKMIILLGCSLSLALDPSAFAQSPKDLKKNPEKVSPIIETEKSQLSTSNTQKQDPVEKSLYDEILQVLQARYADPSLLDSKKLNQAAISGVFNSLEGSVRLIKPGSNEKSPPKTASIHSVSTLNPSIGYLRLERIEDESAKQLETEIQKLIKEKHTTSLILDLRFAYGSNYTSVPSIAANFLPEPKPLFSIQRGNASQSYMAALSVQSTDMPLVILVNHETKEAAEVLAAVLQDQKRAVIIGNSSTAGQAFETSDVKLSNGQILRLATGKISLTHSGNFFLKGVPLDVMIPFDPKLEKEICLKPFQPPKIRSEARMYSEAILTGRENPPPIPSKDKNKKELAEPASNGDSVLLRAMDLLKSIQALGLS